MSGRFINVLDPDRRAARRRWGLMLSLLAGTSLNPSIVRSDQTAIATSTLEFGGSIANLIWVAHEADKNLREPNPDQYLRLATSVKDQIELGRASSSLLVGNFNLISTTIAYASAVDPEPMSRVTLGIAAWGTKKAGDAFGQMIIEESQKQAQTILAQGLKESGFSETDVRNMTAEQLRARIPDLKVGGHTLRDVLKDDPASLNRLQAHATDIATNIGVEAFTRADGAQRTADAVRDDLAKTKKNIEQYQKETEVRLDRIDASVSVLAAATNDAAKKLEALRADVGENRKAVQALAQISFSGWTTAQKLQAVSSGLFADLSEGQRGKLEESLRAEQKREDAIAGLQRTASALGNIAAIASNLGLPPDLVKGIQYAQTATAAITRFATGDYFGAVAGLTSLAGLGAPDAGAQRHAQMMKYLAQQFDQINRKLDKVIELQVATLNALSALADEQRKFRQEVLGQLDRIEVAVLRSETTLQAVLLNQWQDCWALVNGTDFNGQYTIPNRDLLKGILSNANAGTYAGNCFKQISGFFDGNVKSATWSGQIIAALNFPADRIAAGPEIQNAWAGYAAQKERAYALARDAVQGALPTAPTTPAAPLARMSQPVADAPAAASLRAAFAAPAVAEKMAGFKCSDTDVLAPALRDLICFGRYTGQSAAPLPGRWANLLGATLIGPQFAPILDTGIALSSIADLAKRTPDGTFVFPEWSQLANVPTKGLSADLRLAVEEKKGASLLDKLRWLAEANVLQQSITYGDFTAELAVDALYDRGTNTLKASTPEAQRFVAAMRANPVLARNVVMLAMRRVTESALGGADKASAANYRQTYFGLGLSDFRGPGACNGGRAATKLQELFPGWPFEYRATQAEMKDPRFGKCTPEYVASPAPGAAPPPPNMGSGAVLKLADDFYVALPTPLAYSTGLFELPDSLRIALAYRDRVAQAIVDRRIGELVAAQRNDKGEKLNDTEVRALAFALVNEGWAWKTRKSSK